MFHEFIYEFGCTKVPDGASQQTPLAMPPACCLLLANCDYHCLNTLRAQHESSPVRVMRPAAVVGPS